MRVVRCFLIVAVALFTVAAHADGVDALKRFYNEVNTLSAHFEQTQRAADGSIMRQSEGIFLLSRPGKFRWAYQEPYRQIMVSNGTLFKFYDVGLAQVTIRPVTKTLRATPALLLTGGIGLQKAFNVVAAGTHDGLTWLRLMPRSSNSDFKSIRLGLRDGIPVVMELHDKLGQTTEIRFSDIKVNPQIKPSRFDIDVPDDVTVVDTRQQTQ